MKNEYDNISTLDKLKTAVSITENSGDPLEVSNLLLQVLGQCGCGYNCLANNITFFQNILDMIPMPVYYKDIYGVYIGCNDSLARVYKRKKSEIIGRTVFDFFTKEEAAMLSYSDTVLINEKSHEMVEHKGRFSAMGGTYHVLHKKVILNPDGSIAGVLGIINDITEHKQSEERAWQGEAFYKSLYEKSPLPRIIFDSLNIIEDMNPSAFRLFGENVDYVGGDISSIFKSHKQFEKMMNSGGEPVKVKLLDAKGESISAIAILTVCGVAETERFAVSFISTDKLK